jgi:hypothetical protein
MTMTNPTPSKSVLLEKRMGTSGGRIEVAYIIQNNYHRWNPTVD